MLFGEIFVIRFDVDLAWRWSGLSTACGSTGTVTCTTRLKTPRPGREQRPSTRSSVRSSTSSPTRLERSHRSCLQCNAMLQMTTVLMTVWLFIWKCWSCCWRRRVKYYFTVLFVCFHVNEYTGWANTNRAIHSAFNISAWCSFYWPNLYVYFYVPYVLFVGKRQITRSISNNVCKFVSSC